MHTRNILITDVGDCAYCTTFAHLLIKEIIPKDLGILLPKAYKVMVNVTDDKKGFLQENDLIYRAELHQIRFNGDVKILSQKRDLVIDKHNVHQYCSIS